MAKKTKKLPPWLMKGDEEKPKAKPKKKAKKGKKY